MKASIVIRTYNEAKHLPKLLSKIHSQVASDFSWEVVLVDSGSQDGTLKIAADFGCKITHINKENFSFGRSLNIGCESASGDILVFVSGHCIPVDNFWLSNLLAPIAAGKVGLTYGRQIGDQLSRFSEQRVFAKYFPDLSKIPQEGFFCNNANSAVLAKVWQANPFDEELTGLEDMHLAKRLLNQGIKLGYVAESCVYHLHNETWRQVKKRFERESIALQHIMPEIHINFTDVIRYLSSALAHDFRHAIKDRVLIKNFLDILSYRSAQYLGSYVGNNSHKKLSRKRKESYFYPR